uniref:Uncharacterized protein n=1 Tax=Timema tahoe TaxID=61484 RepID=A0A7R9IQ11_9NEOP|nr:unnamed protein product [Timema tahoe]
MICHKPVEFGNLQAHNGLPAACTSWDDTLPLEVKAPGIQLPQKVILLQPGDQPNREPYSKRPDAKRGRTRKSSFWLAGHVFDSCGQLTRARCSFRRVLLWRAEVPNLDMFVADHVVPGSSKQFLKPPRT